MTGKKVGRPGMHRAAHGRIRASIRPELKEEAERVAMMDSRIRSVSRLIESAVALFLAHYKQSNGVLDRDGLPLIRPPVEPTEKASAIYQRKPASGM